MPQVTERNPLQLGIRFTSRLTVFLVILLVATLGVVLQSDNPIIF